ARDRGVLAQDQGAVALLGDHVALELAVDAQASREHQVALELGARADQRVDGAARLLVGTLAEHVNPPLGRFTALPRHKVRKGRKVATGLAVHANRKKRSPVARGDSTAPRERRPGRRHDRSARRRRSWIRSSLRCLRLRSWNWSSYYACGQA